MRPARSCGKKGKERKRKGREENHEVEWLVNVAQRRNCKAVLGALVCQTW